MCSPKNPMHQLHSPRSIRLEAARCAYRIRDDGSGDLRVDLRGG